MPPVHRYVSFSSRSISTQLVKIAVVDTLTMTSHLMPQTHEIEGAHLTLLNMVPSDPDEYKALEKRLVRKVDWRLMPVLVVMIMLK